MTDTTRPNAANRHWARQWRPIGLAVLVLTCVALWAGCSPEKHYKTLAFFFDGVPDPNAPKDPRAADDATTEAANLARRPILVVHKPYAENRCDDCHEGATQGYRAHTKLDSSICLKCHEDVPAANRFMHGPVAVAQCMLCHESHESSIPGLLREAAPALCVRCHVPELLGATPKAHVQLTQSCLDCHVGHGSEKRFLLRVALNQLNTAQPAIDPPPQDAAPRDGEVQP